MKEPKDKGSLDIIIGDEKGGGGDSLAAAKDILAAVRDDDAAALDLALQRHYEACEGMGDEPEEDEGDYTLDEGA